MKKQKKEVKTHPNKDVNLYSYDQSPAKSGMTSKKWGIDHNKQNK